MFEYQEELQRRICQFTGYLKKMYHRWHEEIHGDCFMIFLECPPNDKLDDPFLTEAAKPAVELVLSGFDDPGNFGVSTSEETSHFDLPDEGWKEDNSQRRFIQFAFEQNSFYMEITIQSLFRAEAEQILRRRNGFFFLRDRRPESNLLDDFEPFQKVYIYGDEESAAEDMAFVWFDVWKFPVDSRLYVKASAFAPIKVDWERDEPIE